MGSIILHLVEIFDTKWTTRRNHCLNKFIKKIIFSLPLYGLLISVPNFSKDLGKISELSL